jgi:predicted NUDIX family NTP pyrophosphohydrolase
MANIAAGLLMCRENEREIEFFLVHPGGPFYIKKNEGVWSIPKGLPEDGEDLLETAQREFFEETGIKPKPPFNPLGTVKLKSGKVIHAWCFKGHWEPSEGIVSNIFTMEWPPSSKKFIDVPEVDRAEWMTFEKASIMINPHQIPLLEKAHKIYQPQVKE